MSRRPTAPPRPPAGPPADVETGTAALHGAALKLFRREDGEPADWGLLTTCLFKLGFDLPDKLPAERRVKLADRVQQRAYPYLATEAGTDSSDPLSDGKTATTRASTSNAPALRPR